MTIVRAWAALEAGGKLEPVTFTYGPLESEEVEVAVEYCGICHSDISMLENHWQCSSYPLVPGHEIIGRIVALGSHTKGLSLSQRVGIGWTRRSCMHCALCMRGEQHLCVNAEATIVGNHGGFAQYVRAHWAWVIPLPETLDAAETSPLFCGGITVFSPLLAYNVRPIDRVGVVGIGGLGHLAVKFAHHWGCEVTAFTSDLSKQDEIISLGAHHVVSLYDQEAVEKIAGSLDFLLVTVNVALPWGALMATLAPEGRLHIVGAVLEPIPVQVLELISGQKSLSGSPTGSPAMIASMLDFCARHRIFPQVEHMPMHKANEALARLREGKARYRIVLDADFA